MGGDNFMIKIFKQQVQHSYFQKIAGFLSSLSVQIKLIRGDSKKLPDATLNYPFWRQFIVEKNCYVGHKSSFYKEISECRCSQ